MSNEWEVLTDKRKFDKRFVEIKDIVNKIKYNNFFPLSTNDNAVKARFKAQVKERRTELAKAISTLDLTNFEASL